MVRTHGNGKFERNFLAHCATTAIIEAGVLIFHPENVEIGTETYIGHYAILKAYFKNKMVIGARSWIGQGAFLHAAGGLTIGDQVGVGPGARVITSQHEIPPSPETPVMNGPLQLAPVVLNDGCDIGVGAIVLPGVNIGKGAVIGAGAVVTCSIPAGAIAAGVPAKVLRYR